MAEAYLVRLFLAEFSQVGVGEKLLAPQIFEGGGSVRKMKSMHPAESSAGRPPWNRRMNASETVRVGEPLRNNRTTPPMLSGSGS